MPALDKHGSVFTVVLGRATGAVGCWLVCCTHRSPGESGRRNSKGVAPGAAHSTGSLTEARNADAGLSHMAEGEEFSNSGLEREKTREAFTESNTSLLWQKMHRAVWQTGQMEKRIFQTQKKSTLGKCIANFQWKNVDFLLKSYQSIAEWIVYSSHTTLGESVINLHEILLNFIENM